MLLTIVSFRYPGLPGAAHTALRILLMTVAMLATVIAGVAVLVVIMPYLPALLVGAAVTGLYAMLTQPRSKAARA
jgi:hypothetical protein